MKRLAAQLSPTPNGAQPDTVHTRLEICLNRVLSISIYLPNLSLAEFVVIMKVVGVHALYDPV
jgi:hypothetical protein